jgi:succinate dehydrogenase / fumarate reductase iron-sulfur subunit
LITVKNQKIEFKIFRYDSNTEDKPYFIIYDVPFRHGMTVLDGLIYIIEELDPSLSLRYNCRFKICGSCAVLVNGRQMLACETQVSGFRQVKVEPLPHFKVIKDLVVDIEPFLEKMEAVMPYLYPDERGGEILIQSEEFEKYVLASDCIWCFSCISACPIAGTQPYYLGPAALNQLFRFTVDSREKEGYKELRLLLGDNTTTGVWTCHQVFACKTVCPKKIDPGNSIASLKRMILNARLRHRI